MRFAIPLTDGRLCNHFGHCQQFALIDVDENNAIMPGMKLIDPPPHEPGLLPRWLHEQGANVIIAGGMGHRARQLFDQNGIDVVVGAPVEPPETLVQSHLDGTLSCGENACDH